MLLERANAVATAQRKADKKREAEAKTGKRTLVVKLPPLPEKYDEEYLRRALEYHRVTEQYPWNPRCLEPRTLLDIDMAFVADYEAYREVVQFYYDLPERGGSTEGSQQNEDEE